MRMLIRAVGFVLLSYFILALTTAAPGHLSTSGSYYIDAPPPAHTGGFGEATCHHCHFSEPLNEEQGELSVEGLPARYAPGKTYEFTVRLHRPDMQNGGFQLASRFANGTRTEQQAGSLIPVDDQRVQITEQEGVQYVHHTEEGSALNDERGITWTLEWLAPAESAGPVAFHLAANAGNEDVSEFGDFIYTYEKEIEAEK